MCFACIRQNTHINTGKTHTLYNSVCFVCIRVCVMPVFCFYKGVCFGCIRVRVLPVLCLYKGGVFGS